MSCLTPEPFPYELFLTPERCDESNSKMGAILVDNLEIPSMNVINDAVQSGERALMLAKFKLSLNSYLSELATSPVRSLSDIINFNKHPIEVRIILLYVHLISSLILSNINEL